jgi:hypothetical protein
MDLAHDDYCDWLQGIIRDRIANPQGNRGSDVLVMFAAKAEMPEKYREEVKVLEVSAPLQMLDKLKELAAKDLEAREVLEPQAVEGEFREVAAAGEKRPVQSAIPAPEPPKKTNKPSGRVRRR